jgi:hypothetical protein
MLLLVLGVVISTAATTAATAVSIPHIRDEFCNSHNALEFAILCQTLYGLMTLSNASNASNAKNSSTTESLPYTVLSYKEYGEDNKVWIGKSSTKLIVAFIGADSAAAAAAAADGGGTTSTTHDSTTHDVLRNDTQVAMGPMGYEFQQDMHQKKVLTGDVIPHSVLVHGGINDQVFRIAYDEIVTILLEQLKSSSSPFDNTIYSIGHSLAGARASLFGTYFAYHHPTVATYVETFGQPRCGNMGYKMLLESIPNLNVWRFVHDQDHMVRVPFLQYHHAGHLCWKRRQRQGADAAAYGVVVNNTNNATMTKEYEYEAFFRTIGDPSLELDGIEDFAIARK